MIKTLVARMPPPARRVVRQAYSGFLYARGMLGEPIVAAGAIAAVRARLAGRASLFLDTIERTVFAFPNSPYRALLDAAGYDLARVSALVAQVGVEETLRRLGGDGVYVAIEEFKGFREARRGNHVFRFRQEDFLNPLAGRGMHASSGGTRSRGIPTPIPVATGRLNAEHTAVTWAAYGLEGLPVIVWYPESGDLGVATVLNASARRVVPVRWVKQLPGPGSQTYAHYLGIKAGALVSGITLPPQTYLPVGSESMALPWMTRGVCGRGCVVVTTPSSALRLALAAKREGAGLTNVTFLTTSEPLTPAKLAAIQVVGGRAFSRFSFSELGAAAAYGCPTPASPDDMHVCRDRVALIQRRRVADRVGSEVDALLFTGLRADGQRVLLNMETGDYGRIVSRRCGCLLEEVGWIDHLEEVRSFEKLTPEGVTFLGSGLITLVEETLPAQFGGDPTDYQLVEHEDQDGYSRLTVLVHPRLGTVDEDAIRQCVERAFERLIAPIYRAPIYRRANTLRVRRAAPMMTRAGKVMALHHLR